MNNRTSRKKGSITQEGNGKNWWKTEIQKPHSGAPTAQPVTWLSLQEVKPNILMAITVSAFSPQNCCRLWIKVSYHTIFFSTIIAEGSIQPQKTGSSRRLHTVSEDEATILYVSGRQMVCMSSTSLTQDLTSTHISLYTKIDTKFCLDMDSMFVCRWLLRQTSR